LVLTFNSLIDTKVRFREKTAGYLFFQLDMLAEFIEETTESRIMSPSTGPLLVIALAAYSANNVMAFAPSLNQRSAYIQPQFATGSEKGQEPTYLDPACSIDDEDCIAIASYSSSQELSDASLLQSLQRRSRYLAREPVLKNWESGICPTTKISISEDDAVRRVSMDHYPLVACGSVSGSIYLVDIEAKRVLSSVNAHLSINSNAGGSSDEVKRQAMEKMYGKLDGGGVISIAMQENIVASSGREGGVKLWRIEGDTGDENMQLIPFGSLSTLQNTIVTSVKFDRAGLLWVACYDSTVRAYDLSQWNENKSGIDSKNKLFTPLKPTHRTDFTDSVLDMHLCEELNVGVCATSDGGAALFSLEDGQFFVGLMLFGVAARSVSIVKHEAETNVDMNGTTEKVCGYSVLCGGMDGIIHSIPLNIKSNGRIDTNEPFAVTDETDTSIKPRHTGPVMCLASPGEGMFVSGGQDGALRVWTISGLEEQNETPESKPSHCTLSKCKCIYALTGYKLWLGSACTDGDKLVSDGGENNIIVRDYARQQQRKQS
jgi:WD40 repeat protein